MGWEKEVEALRERQRLAKQMGGPERLERQRAGGKLNVRERVEQLLDPGSFTEVGSIAGKSSYDEAGNLVSLTPASLVIGRGKIEGRNVVVAGGGVTLPGGATPGGSPGK